MEGNAEPGKYRCSRMPWQRDMLNDPLDPAVSEIFWMIASQLGKTLCIVIIVSYYIDQEPSSILVVYPTIDSAKAWVREKFTPSIGATPRMKGLIRDPRSRDSKNTILNKKFPGGNLTASGANSPSGLRQRTKRIVIQDEIDAFEPNQEGDPSEQADKRAETFHDAVKLKSSTPAAKLNSKVEPGFERSDKQRWFCPCPRCHKHQWLKWSQVRWTWTMPDGSPYSDPTKAVYVCEHCDAELTDRERIAMILAGEWRATAPFTGVRGRHMSGLYGLIGKKRAFKSYLHQWVDDFRRAKTKGVHALRVWTNTFLAETWEEEGQEGPRPELIYARREDYEKIPNAGTVVVAFGDVHPDRIEIECMAAGSGEETWGLDYRVFYGNVETWGIWNEVDEYIQKKWPHESGAELQASAIGFDTGHKSKIVQAFVKRCRPRRVFATKGRGSWNTPWISRSKTQALVLIYANVGKEAVYSRANIEAPGPGYMHWNKRYDLEYFRRLFSERIVTRFKFGNAYKTFEERGRNEPLDCRVGCLAMLEILRPNYERLAENLAASVKGEENPVPPPKPMSVIQRRGGLGTGWNI